MTPAQIKLTLSLLFYALVFGAGFLVRGYIADNASNEVLIEDMKQDAKDFASWRDRVVQRDADNLVLQTRLEILETQSIRSLNDEIAENDRLRDDLAAAHRMRLKGTICPARTSPSEESTAGGVGPGVPVEITEATRRLVFDLRESVIKDKKVIDYYQKYNKVE